MNVLEMNLLRAADMTLCVGKAGATEVALIQMSLEFHARGKTHKAPTLWMDADTAQTVALQLLDMAARARTGGKHPTAN